MAWRRADHLFRVIAPAHDTRQISGKIPVESSTTPLSRNVYITSFTPPWSNTNKAFLLLHPQPPMADINPQQVNHLPGDFLPRSTVRPQHNHHVLHNVGVSLVRLGQPPFSGCSCICTRCSLGSSRCQRWPTRRTMGGCATCVGCWERCHARLIAGLTTHQHDQLRDSKLPRATRRERGIHTRAIIFIY